MDVPGYALVTGAGSGIGKATALAFVAEGCAGVAIHDVDPEALSSTAAAIVSYSRERSTKVPCMVRMSCLDVTDEQGVMKSVQETVERFGRLDYVVNCAGIAAKEPGGIKDSSTEKWNHIMDVNLTGTFYVVRAAAKVMAKQEPRPAKESRAPQRGSIVNISSIAGIAGLADGAAYAASKHAVLGLTRSAALDYAAQGIRVNAVCPGYTDTPMTQSPALAETMARALNTLTPMKRAGRPEEVADCVLFLAGGRSSYVTGSALTVDGGYLAF